MADNLKNCVKNILPAMFRPYNHAEKWLLKQSSGKVMSGFFKGMKYVPGSVGSAFFPKIVGSYEIELKSIVESLIAESFDTIINVGAGEGFYAVGFAVKSANSRVVAFETDKDGQKLIGEMSAANEVADRIEIKEMCKAENLRSALQNSGSALVVMDIEGDEKQILDPEIVPELKNAQILVELHDCIYRDVAETIRERFSGTHEIAEIWSRDRQISDFPIRIPLLFKTLFQKHFLYFMDEGRPEKMRWYYMKPLSGT